MNPQSNEDITKIIKKMISESGFTQKQVGEALGISPQYFCNKLARRSFSALDFFKIAEICGCRISITIIRRIVEEKVLEL